MYTIIDILRGHECRDLAKKTAVIDGSRSITYGDLLSASRGYSRILGERGLERGDRVGIYLRRSLDAVVAFFGCYAAGAVPVFINEVLRPQQVNYILEHSGAAALITDTRLLLSVPEVVIHADQIINVDKTALSDGRDWSGSLISADLALIIYTSGSTGLPKGVMLSHQNLLAGAHIVADYLKLSGEDIVISLLPFSFDYGLNQLLSTLAVGGTLVIQRSMTPPDICRTLERHQVTGMAAVPTLWLQLCEGRSPFLKTNFPALRYVTNSGGRLPEHVITLIRQAHPHVDVYLMYGLTEAFRSTYLPPHDVDARPGSIGKAIPNTEILIVNEHGGLCGVDEVGELVHRGATVGMGYWRDADSTAMIFRPHPAKEPGEDGIERVVFSGDLVKRDAEGYLYFIGRRDQLIKSMGFRVSPDEIEQTVHASDLVSNVVAFSVSSDDDDSKIVLAVKPKDAMAFDEEQLHRFCKRVMPPYMRPEIIWTIAEVSQTSTGKPDRVAIKEAYVHAFARA